MREILFRGKTIISDTWVFGDLIQRIDSDGSKHFVIENNNFNEYRSYQVVHQTVGQFTGLTDKNGVKIFEGDILQEKSKYGTVNCKVVYESHYWRFRSKNVYWNFHSEMSVIGNIHDNPELINN